jgi:hypothetical protein
VIELGRSNELLFQRLVHSRADKTCGIPGHGNLILYTDLYNINVSRMPAAKP